MIPDGLSTGGVHAVLVMGVSGCGKSTLGAALARRLGWSFVEGDDFHPEANITKMRAGIPLTDTDRWPWLDALAREVHRRRSRDERVVIACSALKASYRARVLDACAGQGAVVVHLVGEVAALAAALEARSGSHFMPASLLTSQFAALEPPRADEPGVANIVEVPAFEDVERQVDRVVASMHIPSPGAYLR